MTRNYEGSKFMPTDLEALLARKLKAQRETIKERQTNTTMLSVWIIICLVMLVLAFIDTGYAEAMAEMMNLF